MKMKGMNQYLAFCCLTLLLLAVGCKEKNTVGTAAMLSGNESKTWRTTKEITASGENNKVTQAEKRQEIQFFAMGSFRMRAPDQNASGKWTYDVMARTLTLQFVGSDMTETFQVLRLTDDEMTLQAADGSKMEMEAD